MIILITCCLNLYVNSNMSISSEEEKFLHLLSLNNSVSSLSHVKLQSYYNLYVSSIADQYNLNLPKGFKNRNKCCPYCLTPWKSETLSLKLLPPKKFDRFQQQRLNKDKRQNEKTPEQRNVLVFKCKVCTKKSKFSLLKKQLVKEVLKTDATEVSYKKKKKKKDKTCGLAVTLIESKSPAQTPFISMKEKPFKTSDPGTTEKSSKSLESPSMKNTSLPKIIPSNKGASKLIINPFAKIRPNKRKGAKLKELKQAVKESKGVAKKTLKDFLKLV